MLVTAALETVGRERVFVHRSLFASAMSDFLPLLGETSA
jgi:hypothetical protein